ncbi:ribosomal protein S27AE [Streptomyces afghaniensis]|nr:ribosomal protein S27AE [Streptomyces afghaniensis]
MPAQAERGVEARHDRPPHRGHEVHGGAVEGDVDPAVRGAEDQQDEAEREGRVGQRGQGHAEGEQHGTGDGDPVVAEAAAQAAGEDHRDDGSGGDAQEGEAEGAGGGVGLFLDGGDADDPASEDEAVEGEEDGDRCTECGEGVAVARHGTVRSGFVYLRHKLRLGGCGHRDKVRRWDESHPPRDLGSVHGT